MKNAEVQQFHSVGPKLLHSPSPRILLHWPDAQGLSSQSYRELHKKPAELHMHSVQAKMKQPQRGKWVLVSLDKLHCFLWLLTSSLHNVSKLHTNPKATQINSLFLPPPTSVSFHRFYLIPNTPKPSNLNLFQKPTNVFMEVFFHSQDLITTATGQITLLQMPLWYMLQGLMQVVGLQPSSVSLALSMKQFILQEFCKEQKRLDWYNHYWVFLLFFSFWLKRQILNGVSEIPTNAHGRGCWGSWDTGHGTVRVRCSSLDNDIQRDLTTWASRVQFLSVIEVSGR